MKHDAIVLGLGGIGAAALAHLAARGLSVVGLEQDDVPSLRGSSVGETRVIRKAYFEDARYVPLLERAYRLWRALEERERAPLFVRTGCLTLGPRDHAAVRGSRESAERHGLPHRVMDEEAMRAAFPAIVPSRGDVGVFEQDAGFLRVEACTAAHVRSAIDAGAIVRTEARVASLDLGGAEVKATLDDGATLTADTIVIAAGAWLASAPPLADVARDLPVHVERQVQTWLAPKDRGLARPPSLPVFVHFVPGGAFYALPPDEAHESPAVKVCRHHGGRRTTADALDRTVHAADEADVRAYVREHLPVADGPLVRARVCMYTNTPDEHFLVGRLAKHPRAVLLGGFSGHGYKMASVIGEIAADLVTKGRSDFDLGMFDPARFA